VESLKSEERTMADVMVMKEIEETADRLGIDLASLDLDAIRLPPGEDFGIAR
jgi:translation initiation factor 3 subunit B